jgi:hypothetical protein
VLVVPLPLLLLVFVFAVVDNAANRRLGIGSDEDEVQAGVLGHLKRFSRLQDSVLLAVGTDQPEVGISKAASVNHRPGIRPNLSTGSSYVFSPFIYLRNEAKYR